MTSVFGSRRLTSLLHPVSLSFALLGLLITIFAASTLYNSEKQTHESQFVDNTSRLRGAIQERINTYAQILRGGSAFFASTEEVTRDKWKNYVEGLDVDLDYPGVQGIGYAQFVTGDEVEAFEGKVRSEGFEDFRIWPRENDSAHVVTVYLEPFDERNQRAMGYDMFSEETRRVAMERCRDSGLPSVSGTVTLKQESEHDPQAGFLLYVPLYHNDGDLTTVEGRRQALRGFVFSSFRMDDFMTGVLTDAASNIGIRILDPGSGSPMYASPTWNPSHAFSSSSNLSLAGNIWTIETSGSGRHQDHLPRLTSLAVALAGMGLTLFGVVVLADSRSTQEKATEMAMAMTDSLREREREVVQLNNSLEEKVARRTARLKEANQELSAFSYTLSHDLRTPVRHIDLLTEALQEDHEAELRDEAKDYLRKIRSAASHMEQLIEDILTLASQAHATIKPREIDLSEMVNELVVGLSEARPDPERKVTVESGLRAVADPVMTRVILQNLLENALKFSAGETKPEIEFGRVDDYPGEVYYLRDNGIGFDMKYADNVFQPFKRLHRKSEIAGTGIGMATVKKLVGRHDGEICCYSESGVGTTFYFTLEAHQKSLNVADLARIEPDPESRPANNTQAGSAAPCGAA
ncbi:MAG: CHASE domain-containing protein [Verrucomicrobiales bacterium]